MTARRPNPMTPVRCSAKSSRSGLPCRRWASQGQTKCSSHGGASPQAKSAARRRLALAVAMKTGERRRPTEVLIDAAHYADTLTQQTIDRLADAGATITPELVDALTDAIKLSAGLARTALDAGVDEAGMVLRSKPIAEGVHRVIVEVLAALGLSMSDDAVRQAVAAAVRAELVRHHPSVEPPAVKAKVVRARPVRALEARSVEPEAGAAPGGLW